VSAGGAIYGLGQALPCETLTVASYPVLGVGALALAPTAILMALSAITITLLAAVLIPLLPPMIVLSIWHGRTARRLLRHIDALDVAGGSEEEYDKAFAEVRKRSGYFREEAAKRVLEEGWPSCRRWLEFVWDEATLREVAMRSSCPLAPFAWARAIADVGVVALWVRASLSDDPFALPPELANGPEVERPPDGG